MIILICGWCALVVYGLHFVKTAQNEAIGKANSLALRGVCAIEIMVGHLGIATNSIYLFPNRKAGILFVGIFFALSGYGLAYSVATNKAYIIGFLRRRIPKVLVPAYIIYAIGVILYAMTDDFPK